MAKVNIKTTKKNRAGRRVQIAPDVFVDFDENLEAEVDEKHLEVIAERDESIFIPDDEDSDDGNGVDASDADSDGDSKDDSNKEDADTDEDGDETDSDEPAYTKKDLENENKSFTEDLAKEMGLPEEEWEDLNKSPLIDYVIEHLNN